MRSGGRPDLADEEADIADQVAGLGNLTDQDRVDRIRRLMERKEQMEAQVADFERGLDSTSAEFRRDERDASRALQDAANGIRESKLKEKIRYSRGLVRARSPEYARQFEEEIGGDIGDLERHLADAAEAVGNSRGSGLEQALDRTRDLMRSLESLEQRIQQGGEQAATQQGQQGQGQQGQEGQQGQGQGQQGGGQQQGDGQRGGQVAGGGGGDTFGGPFGWGGPGNRRAGVFDPRDIRQWQREFRERGMEAQELQRMLRAENLGEVGDLSEIIQAMRAPR